MISVRQMAGAGVILKASSLTFMVVVLAASWDSAGPLPGNSLYMASPNGLGFLIAWLSSKGKNAKRQSQPEAVLPIMAQP